MADFMTVKQKFRIHSQKQLSQIRPLEIINSYHSSSAYPAEIICCIKKSAEYFRGGKEKVFWKLQEDSDSIAENQFHAKKAFKPN